MPGAFNADFNLDFGPWLNITTLDVFDGRIDILYDETLSAAGGELPFTWSQPSGTLPSGISLVDDNIIGTPVATGIFNFTVKLVESGGLEDYQDLTIQIYEAAVGSTVLRTTNTMLVRRLFRFI